MLPSRNLDDQNFEQIMEYVTGRLPWLCPEWTDYNAHDPGITILELIAWYKEMQQYHMNVVPDSLRRKLLKLLGASPKQARPAGCLVSLGEPGRALPVLTRLENPQGICFELLEPACDQGRVEAVYLADGEGVEEMTEVMNQPQLSLWPFAERPADTELLIGLSGSGEKIRLWFEVDDKRAVPRNPFAGEEELPRELQWGCSGSTQPPIVTDETHALSHSGFITFQFPKDFRPDDGGRGLPLFRYLTLRQLDGGCEEEIRLVGVQAGYWRAAQQESWAAARWYTVSEEDESVWLDDAVSQQGGIYLFARDAHGLRALQGEIQWENGGMRACFAGETLLQDGSPNLLVVSQDALRYGRLFFPSTGLPDMTLELSLGERQVLPQRLVLICDTLCEDGQVRPALWRYVDDLKGCGARDRVFTYEAQRKQLLFGNGRHGAVPVRGERAILVASLVLSHCGAGNIPENASLALADGSVVGNTAAEGGREAQSTGEAAREFLASLEQTKKCASQEDYERAAKATPGLRVAAAKAIAGFDPDEPSGRSRMPVVTVVVLPGSARPRPLPDQRFLGRIQAYLERLRPVCTVVKVIAPVYLPVDLSVEIEGAGAGLEKAVRETAARYFAVGEKGRGIGDAVIRDDLLAAFMALENVYRIKRLELRPLGPDCYIDPRGDLQLKRNVVACLGRLHLEIR